MQTRKNCYGQARAALFPVPKVEEMTHQEDRFFWAKFMCTYLLPPLSLGNLLNYYDTVPVTHLKWERIIVSLTLIV